MNSRFPTFINNTAPQAGMRDIMTKMMKESLHNETLEKLVIPDFPVGCRRFTPGINYLETLRTEKVQVVYGQVQEITEKGCIGKDGKEYAVDVLICATGFDTSYKPRFPIVGKNGIKLSEAWASEAESYLGPNSPIGNGPVLVAVGEFPYAVSYYIGITWS